MKNNKLRALTHGIANKGFRGMRRLTLASNSVYIDKLSLRYPLLAIPSNVMPHARKKSVQCLKNVYI
jgi:hypothetical protein